MARVAGEIFKARPVAGAGRCPAEINAAAWVERALARNRSDGGLGKNRRRIYFSAFRAGGVTRRHSLRARAATRVALRARTSFEDRHPAEIETALRRESDSRHPFSGRINHEMDTNKHEFMSYSARSGCMSPFRAAHVDHI